MWLIVLPVSVLDCSRYHATALCVSVLLFQVSCNCIVCFSATFLSFHASACWFIHEESVWSVRNESVLSLSVGHSCHSVHNESVWSVSVLLRCITQEPLFTLHQSDRMIWASEFSFHIHVYASCLSYHLGEPLLSHMPLFLWPCWTTVTSPFSGHHGEPQSPAPFLVTMVNQSPDPFLITMVNNSHQPLFWLPWWTPVTSPFTVTMMNPSHESLFLSSWWTSVMSPFSCHHDEPQSPASFLVTMVNPSHEPLFLSSWWTPVTNPFSCHDEPQSLTPFPVAVMNPNHWPHFLSPKWAPVTTPFTVTMVNPNHQSILWSN